MSPSPIGFGSVTSSSQFLVSMSPSPNALASKDPYSMVPGSKYPSPNGLTPKDPNFMVPGSKLPSPDGFATKDPNYRVPGSKASNPNSPMVPGSMVFTSKDHSSMAQGSLDPRLYKTGSQPPRTRHRTDTETTIVTQL